MKLLHHLRDNCGYNQGSILQNVNEMMHINKESSFSNSEEALIYFRLKDGLFPTQEFKAHT
jgi:hypothetical protein